MPDQIPNLWPDDFGKPPNLTPLAILKQQGVFLGEKTKNLVLGEVRSLAGADFVRHFFEISAPFLGYKHDLFYVEHDPINLYPVEFKGRGVLASTGKAETSDQFLEKLKEILNSPETTTVVQSLIAQSTA